MATPGRILTEVKVVVGGRLDACLSGAWVTPVTKVENAEFITVHRMDTKFAKFVHHKFAMMDYLLKLRNRAVDDAMITTCSADADPMHDVDVQHLPKRPRREMFDEISSKIVSVKVMLLDGRHHTMRVVATVNTRAKLCIEATEENVNVLLQEPRELAEQVVVPDMTEANVRWNKTRFAVFCKYYCNQQSKYRWKFMKVPYGPDFQERVTRMASVCQAFYTTHHTEPQDDDDEHAEEGEDAGECVGGAQCGDIGVGEGHALA